MDDARIIELYFARSESAIEETAIKYGAYLNQIAYNILRSSDDTEEILNDTYLGAWNAIPPARPLILRHFLSRIARNLSFKRLEYLSAGKRSGHAVQLLSELEECIPSPTAGPEELWDAKELGLSLNRFLETLNTRDRALFVCRYYYGLSIMELTEKYRVNTRQVKHILSRCRAKLRQHLAKEGISI